MSPPPVFPGDSTIARPARPSPRCVFGIACRTDPVLEPELHVDDVAAAARPGLALFRLSTCWHCACFRCVNVPGRLRCPVCDCDGLDPPVVLTAVNAAGVWGVYVGPPPDHPVVPLRDGQTLSHAIEGFLVRERLAGDAEALAVSLRAQGARPEGVHEWGELVRLAENEVSSGPPVDSLSAQDFRASAWRVLDMRDAREVDGSVVADWRWVSPSVLEFLPQPGQPVGPRTPRRVTWGRPSMATDEFFSQQR